jgi:DNA primase
LALMQMNGQATLAVPGTSFLGNHVVPPSPCKTIVLAPDNDEVGRQAIEKAMPRLRTLGLTVRVLLPPPERDWCDILPEFEERRAIVEEELYG